MPPRRRRRRTGGADEDGTVPSADGLDLARLDSWSDGELARAWTSGLLRGLPGETRERLAEEYSTIAEEE